jgi:hypothetical protein
MNCKFARAWPLVLVGAQVTWGEVSLQLIDRGVPSAGGVEATGYNAYTLRIVNDSGRITAADLDTGIYGIYGSLVQQWFSDDEDGVYLRPTPGFIAAQNLTPSPANFDSHFLPPGQTLTMVSPAEDASIGAVGTQFGSFPVNTMGAGIGQGSRLRSAYGIVFPSQASSLDLAYVVIPSSGTITVAGEAAISNGSPVWISSARAWTGSGSWTSSPSNPNWRMWGNAVAFHSGDDVQFTSAGVASGPTVQIDPQGVAPRDVTIMHDTGNYVFAGGPINASGSIRLRTRGGSVTFNSPVTAGGSVLFDGGSVWINDTFSTSSIASRGDGTIGGNGTVSGVLNCAAFTTISPGGDGSIGTFTVDRIKFSDPGSLRFELAATGHDQLIIAQPDGFDVVREEFCNLTRLTSLAAGTYPLMSYSGAAPANLERLKLGTPGIGGFMARLVNNPENHSIDLVLGPGPSWQLDAGGSWSNAAAWSGGVPNGPGIPVTFGPVITAPRTIKVRDNFHLGSLRFDSSISYSVVKDFGGQLLFSALEPDEASIDVVDGSHTLSVSMDLHRDLFINVARPSSTLTVGRIYGLQRSLTKNGPGTLKATEYLEVKNVIVNQGTFDMRGLDEDTTCSVAGGAVLAGWGTAPGTITLASGAHLSPGDPGSPKAIVSVGALSLHDSQLDFDLTSSGADKIEVTGADKFLFEGVSAINLTISGMIPRGAYTLIDYTGAPLADLDHLVLNVSPATNVPLLLAYDPTNTRIDLVVGDDLVPEPSWLGFAFVAGLFGLRRRRQMPDFA